MIRLSRMLMFLFVLFMTLPVMQVAVPLDDRDAVEAALYPDVDIVTALDASSLEGDDAYDVLYSYKVGPVFMPAEKTAGYTGGEASRIFPLWRPPMVTIS